jgi:hypothetical protein
VVNLSTQDQRDIKALLLFDFKSRNDEINATLSYKMIQNLLSKSRKSVRVTPLIASSCCTTLPNPMWPTEFKNK